MECAAKALAHSRLFGDNSREVLGLSQCILKGCAIIEIAMHRINTDNLIYNPADYPGICSFTTMIRLTFKIIASPKVIVHGVRVAI